MVKIGDTVKLVEKDRGWCCARNFGRNGIVTGVSGNYARVTFEGDDLPCKTDSGNIEALKVVSTTPPQKITQNGYEYSLVGPVKPEWLVDGAWVVDKETGRKYLVSCDNGVYTFNNGTREVIIDFISLPTRFRPHTASDYKWGDWAMYGNERVFVIRVGSQGTCVITRRSSDSVFDYVPVSELAPTF